MSDSLKFVHNRRAFIGGGLGVGALLLSGCATLPGLSLTDAVRRLLLLSSENAFQRFMSDEGYWDSQIANLGLGNILNVPLVSSMVKSRLSAAFPRLARKGAERAAPLVADAIRASGFAAAEMLIRGGPKAATEFLRGEMGNSLVEAMVPEFGRIMRAADDPVIASALSLIAGVELGRISSRLSNTVNNAIWSEIGNQEAAIRANPKQTGDPLLIGVFGIARGL